MLIAPLPPPAVIAPALQNQVPLSFLGFRAGMPVAIAASFVKASGGTFSCKPVPGSQKQQQCSGSVPFSGFDRPFDIRIVAVHDSVARLVLTTHALGGVAEGWASSLRLDFGPPIHEEQPGTQQSWRWSTRDQTILVVERKMGDMKLETSATLTQESLLGSADPERKPAP
ncbi:MAG TPA: hypothetical protein VGQ73_04160 [Gemmatimonadales bacterium]|jgi:hypothetical protein|nr:hypothetical protein [Gemmatimonadales bacterium]